MIDNKGTILRNLEDQVQYLTDINQLASLGFRVKGTVTHSSFLVVDATCVNGDIMIVGFEPPYHLWTFVIDEWIDLGEFPRSGPPGARGMTGATGKTGPIGPIGPIGPTGATGKNGKNGNGLGVENITHLDLAVGDPTVTYSTTGGARLSKQGQIVAAEQQYNITVYDEMPILAGDNIAINADSTKNAIVISSDAPVKSVNGKTGAVVLKTSDLENNSNYVTTNYHDNSKQDKLVSGENIKTVNNQSILGSGNITIDGGGVESVNGKTGAITLAAGNNVTINESGNTLTINATGGGGGTDTGFGNVREIQAADDHTTYNPDTGEYVITSGNADIFYKDGTKATIPYVQAIGLMAGDNITFTEELIDNTNWRLKINATGGGSGSGNPTNGFYPYNVAVTDSPTVGSTYSYADSNVTYPTGCSYFQGQMIIDPNGVIYKVIGTTMCNCVYIPQSGGTVTLPLVNLQNITEFPYTSNFTDEQANTLENQVASAIGFTYTDGIEYHVTCYLVRYDSLHNEYKWRYEDSSVVFEIVSVLTRTTGDVWTTKEFTITKSTPGGGGGGGSSLYQHTITMQGSQYKYKITVVNSYQGSITSSSIWKEIYGTNRFTVPAIVTDSMDKTAAISSVYVYILPTNGISILFFPANGSSQNSETISSSATWEDNIISL